MKYRNDLKIEFRAVPYASESKVLEYRISPNQDISYRTEVSFFGIKFKRKKKFKTNWHRPYEFVHIQYNPPDDEEHCWIPIFIDNKSELESYKVEYKTVGDFFAWLDDVNTTNKSKWKKAWIDYLQHCKETWY